MTDGVMHKNSIHIRIVSLSEVKIPIFQYHIMKKEKKGMTKETFETTD